jgi:hypothetical protein
VIAKVGGAVLCVPIEIHAAHPFDFAQGTL